jgi:hypothetical protein
VGYACSSALQRRFDANEYTLLYSECQGGDAIRRAKAGPKTRAVCEEVKLEEWRRQSLRQASAPSVAVTRTAAEVKTVATTGHDIVVSIDGSSGRGRARWWTRGRSAEKKHEPTTTSGRRRWTADRGSFGQSVKDMTTAGRHVRALPSARDLLCASPPCP